MLPFPVVDTAFLTGPSTQSIHNSAGFISLVEANYLNPAFLFSRASSGTAFRTDGLLVEFGNNVPRFTDLGLWLGGQRTNLIQDARTVGRTGWSNTGVTASITTGPNGIVGDATTLTEDANTSTHSTVFSSISYTSGLVYTASVLARAGTCGTVQLTFPSGAFGPTAFANFNLLTGTLGTVGAGCTASIRQFGSWYQIQVTATATTTVSTTFAIAMTNSATSPRFPSYLGSGRTLDLALAQMEQALFASTPILPPIGSPAITTRLADNNLLASLAALGLSMDSTLYGRVYQPTAYQGRILGMSDGTNANRWFVESSSAGQFNISRTTTGVTASNTGVQSWTPGQSFGIAISGLADSNIRLSVNGAASSTLSGAPTSGLNQLQLGESMFGAWTFLRAIPRSVSNIELEALSIS